MLQIQDGPTRKMVGVMLLGFAYGQTGIRRQYAEDIDRAYTACKTKILKPERQSSERIFLPVYSEVTKRVWNKLRMEK
jgi:hypothetical protein